MGFWETFLEISKKIKMDHLIYAPYIFLLYFGNGLIFLFSISRYDFDWVSLFLLVPNYYLVIITLSLALYLVFSFPFLMLYNKLEDIKPLSVWVTLFFLSGVLASEFILQLFSLIQLLNFPISLFGFQPTFFTLFELYIIFFYLFIIWQNTKKISSE